MGYKDKLQAKLEAWALKTHTYNFNQEQLIGLIMLKENLFYEEASARWKQARGILQQQTS